MTIYCISGLAADRTAFQNLSFPASSTVEFLDWLVPFPKETLTQYASRLADNINSANPFCLVGLSMGGMIAVEICKIVKPEKLVIISSASCREEIPIYFRLAATLKIHKLLPYQINNYTRLLYWFLGVETKQDKELVDFYIENSSIDFLIWSVDAILTWKNNTRPAAFLHVHGTKDRLLPVYFTSANERIAGAGHLMILNKAAEVSKIITQYLFS